MAAPDSPYRELAIAFLKLGTVAFGGPAAHIAMMDQEFVERRQWFERSQLMDMIGFTSLIPGPNSTELAILIGLEIGGIGGLIIAGTCFILPALLIVWGFAVIYTQFQTLPQLGDVLYGIKPVIIGLLLHALWKLRGAATKNIYTIIVTLGAIALFYGGINEIILLIGSGLIVALLQNWRSLFSLSLVLVPQTVTVTELLTDPPTTWNIFIAFFKIGAVLYGGGYVLLAFLQKELVERLGWLTPQQLLDAVAVGQFTPGPLFTTATFVGYLINGNMGAIAATVGIFLPSFIFVAIFYRFLERLKQSLWIRGFLDGVNGAAVGLIVPATIQLGQAAIIDPISSLITLSTAVLLWRTKVSTPWLIFGGGAIGLISGFVVIR